MKTNSLFSAWKNNRNNNQAIVIGLIVLSLLPAVLNFFGVDFGSAAVPLDPNKLQQGNITQDDQFRALSGAIHHALLEWSAVTIAVIGCFISFLHYRRVGDVTIPIIGLALLCAGVLDAFHVLAASRVISANTPNADFSPFTWAISRFFNSLIIIIGVVINLWIYRHFGRTLTFNRLAIDGVKILVNVALLFFGLVIALIIFSQQSKALPQTVFPQALITRPFDVLPLALYTFAGVISWMWYLQERSIAKLAVLLSVVPQILCQLHMSFGSIELSDNHFNIGHGLKVLAYITICMGILLDLVFSLPPRERKRNQESNIKVHRIQGNDVVEVGSVDRPQVVILPVVVFVLALSLTIVVGGSFYLDSSYLVEQQQIEKLRSETNFVEPMIKALYKESSSDVRFLSRTPPIQGIISALERDDSVEFELWKDRIEQILTEHLANQTNYLQIRFIGLADQGREIINVTRVNNIIHRIPRSRLQQKGEYAYVQDTVKLLPNQVYFSKLEFNREFGKVTLPYQPVLRVGTPVYHPRTGEPFGLIVINIDVKAFLRQISEFNTDELQIYIANSEGDFIFHPQESRQFGYELGRRYLMQNEFPQLAAIIEKNADEVTLDKIYDAHEHGARSKNSFGLRGFYRLIRLEEFGSGRPLRLLLTVDDARLQQYLTDYRNRSILLGLALAVIALAVAVLASRRLVYPLVQTTVALEHLEKTGELLPLPVESRDEIGVLARRFQNLLSQRQAQDKELADQSFAINQHTIVAVTDIKGNITYANSKFCDISGYSEQELIGQNHRILNSGFHDTKFFRDMYLAISSGRIWQDHVCNKSKAGELYWVDTTIVPVMDDDKPRSYIALRTDITQQKQVELELIAAKEDAEQAALAKSEFLASMSHEIRTPMNGVLGMLNLVLKSDLSDEQAKRLKMAQNSAQSLLTLINDILDFSKVEAGKLDLEMIDFNIHKFISDFTDAMAFRAHEKKLELILDVSNLKISHVRGDPGRLRQILTNLVGNSIKFTEVGEIVVKVGLTRVAGSNLIFTCSVTDTGIGIPTDKIDKLFESFTQVDASTTRQYGGTGLGLSIVKKLCLLMDGSISATSQLGQGSCFEFSVRLEDSDQQSLAVPSVNLSALRILIVDDNETNRSVLRGQLEQWGARVVETENGESALELLKQKIDQNQAIFDAAFIDMQMPKMNGAELGRQIKRDERLKSMKLIMMTSASQRGDAKLFANIGFSAYFPKPATTNDLFDALAIITDGGPVLQQANPLVTSHYLNSLSRQRKEKEIFKTIHWPASTRLLLVEDNHINQEVALGQLNDMDLHADVAGNGQEAIDCLLHAPIDAPYTLILMDCQMPVIDGFEATRLIKEGKAGKNNSEIPIIAMTANAMKGDKDKCLQAGMVDYISKPIDSEILKDTLCRWLLGESPKTQKEESYQAHQEKRRPENANYLLQGVWDQPAALKRVGGKEARLQQLINMFFKNMPERIARLEEAINDQRLDEVASTAHEIKGVLGNLSADTVMRAAGEIEQAGRCGDKDQIDQVMPEFLHGFHQLNTRLDQYLNGPAH